MEDSRRESRGWNGREKSTIPSHGELSTDLSSSGSSCVVSRGYRGQLSHSVQDTCLTWLAVRSPCASPASRGAFWRTADGEVSNNWNNVAACSAGLAEPHLSSLPVRPLQGFVSLLEGRHSH